MAPGGSRAPNPLFPLGLGRSSAPGKMDLSAAKRQISPQGTPAAPRRGGGWSPRTRKPSRMTPTQGQRLLAREDSRSSQSTSGPKGLPGHVDRGSFLCPLPSPALASASPARRQPAGPKVRNAGPQRAWARCLPPPWAGRRFSESWRAGPGQPSLGLLPHQGLGKEGGRPEKAARAAGGGGGRRPVEGLGSVPTRSQLSRRTSRCGGAVFLTQDSGPPRQAVPKAMAPARPCPRVARLRSGDRLGPESLREQEDTTAPQPQCGVLTPPAQPTPGLGGGEHRQHTEAPGKRDDGERAEGSFQLPCALGAFGADAGPAGPQLGGGGVARGQPVSARAASERPCSLPAVGRPGGSGLAPMSGLGAVHATFPAARHPRAARFLWEEAGPAARAPAS